MALADKRAGTAVLALSLVTYAPEMESAMRFVFGNTLVVSSSSVGQAIANQGHQQNRRRCVNLEGDTFDTTGSLSGGWVNTSNLFLNTYKEVVQLKSQQQGLEHKQAENRQAVEELQESLVCRDTLKQRLSEKQSRLDQCKEDLKQEGRNSEEVSKQSLLEEKTDVES